MYDDVTVVLRTVSDGSLGSLGSYVYGCCLFPVKTPKILWVRPVKKFRRVVWTNVYIVSVSQYDVSYPLSTDGRDRSLPTVW